LSRSASFVLGIFKIGSWELFAWGWLWTMILLIFASWVAGITGVSHWHRLTVGFFFFFSIFLLLFICAYKAGFISPPCTHPLPYHPLCPLPQYPAETILPLFLILL
jgi:hypothetical protein